MARAIKETFRSHFNKLDWLETSDQIRLKNQVGYQSMSYKLYLQVSLEWTSMAGRLHVMTGYLYFFYARESRLLCNELA